MKSKEYFKFVVSKIENDLRIYSSSGELRKCIYLLGILKSSDNLLKDIYIISRIKNLKNLGNYLLFILKKTEIGEVKFDNLLENLNFDKEFIKTELLNCFSIATHPESEPESGKEKQKKEEEKEEKITSEIKRIMAESKFKVEEIDNELVTEEFIESSTKEDSEIIFRGNYLELLQPENEFEDTSVFSLPTDKSRQEKEEDVPIEESDVFSLPGETPKEKVKITEEKSFLDSVNIEEIEEIELEKIKDEIPEITEIKEEEEIVKSDDKEEMIPQESIKEEPEKTTDTEEKIIEEVITEERKEELKAGEKDNSELTENIEIAELENSVYMKYETELLTSNVLLRNNMNELNGLNSEEEGYADRKNILIKEIVDSSTYMEEYSRKMSFEVITSIYYIMKMTFSTYGKTVGCEIIALFKDSINLVESLIKGEDFAGYDSVMKSLDVLKQTLMDIRKDENIEIKPDEEKDDLDKHLITKEYDTNERQKLTLLKQNIIDVENVFKSIEEIKGKFQAYEALRKLSHTFTHFKELVSIANSLDMRKLAQLAEASYIFVKFIQNYRMNPFESEVSEVFKYIIYNFKLIFLDKPTKDIDLLISYLNDPVKIFEKKEK